MKTKIQIKKKMVIKIMIIWVVASMILIGSLPGNGNGSVWPFHIKKTGVTYGISFAFYADYKPGSKHYGLNLSVVNNQIKSNICGGDVSILAKQGDGSEVKGVVISLVGGTGNRKYSEESTLKGIELSLANLNFNAGNNFLIDKKVEGVQIGLIYNASSGRCLQIGIYNQLKKENKGVSNSFLINF